MKKSPQSTDSKLIKLICPVCKKLFISYLSERRKYCSRDCSFKDHIGSNNSFFGKKHTAKSKLLMKINSSNGKRKVLHQNGYIYIWKPEHPLAIFSRIPAQVLMAEKVLGRYLKKGEIVHHINGIKTDNRNSNLLICSEFYHKSLHAKLNGFGTKIQSNTERDTVTGRFIPGVKIFEKVSAVHR